MVSVLHELSIIRTEAAFRPHAYQEEFQTRHDDSITMGIIFATFIPCSLVLIFAARAIPKSPRRSFIMMWIYAMLQLAAGVALGVTFMRAIYHSPGGMLFFIGAFPGLIACAYPAFLLIYLPFIAERFLAEGTLDGAT
jgi:hypothetical protein